MIYAVTPAGTTTEVDMYAANVADGYRCVHSSFAVEGAGRCGQRSYI